MGEQPWIGERSSANVAIDPFSGNLGTISQGLT